MGQQRESPYSYDDDNKERPVMATITRAKPVFLCDGYGNDDKGTARTTPRATPVFVLPLRLRRQAEGPYSYDDIKGDARNGNDNKGEARRVRPVFVRC